MKTTRRFKAAFTALDLIFSVVVVAMILALVILPAGKVGGKAVRIKCVNNLKYLGLAARIFESTHSGLYPGEFLSTNRAVSSITALDVFGSLQAELGTPHLLVCPADLKATPTNGWKLSARNISYFASLTASGLSPGGFLFGDSNLQIGSNAIGSGMVQIPPNAPIAWTAERHVHQGNIALADGSVQQLTTPLLQQALLRNGKTNVLVFP